MKQMELNVISNMKMLLAVLLPILARSDAPSSTSTENPFQAEVYPLWNYPSSYSESEYQDYVVNNDFIYNDGNESAPTLTTGESAPTLTTGESVSDFKGGSANESAFTIAKDKEIKTIQKLSTPVPSSSSNNMDVLRGGNDQNRDGKTMKSFNFTNAPVSTAVTKSAREEKLGNPENTEISATFSQNATRLNARAAHFSHFSETNSPNYKLRSSEIQHIDLQRLEEDLSKSKASQNKELLVAISILQHHLNFSREDDGVRTPGGSLKTLPKGESKKQEGRATLPIEIQSSDALNEFMESVNETDEGLTETSGIYEVKSLENLQWYVLVMDGECAVVRPRMDRFIRFLKAALSAKLKADFDDIYVPSIYCDKAFMANVSLDVSKYPDSQKRLLSLAKANTTLLEISGEIFFLDKIITKDSPNGTIPHSGKRDDVELVIYIAFGCVSIFILISFITAVLIKLCRQEESDETDSQECLHKVDFAIRRPNVIYTRKFSQSLNYLRGTYDPCPAEDAEGVMPSSSRSCETYFRRESDLEGGCADEPGGVEPILEEAEEADDEAYDPDFIEDDDEEEYDEEEKEEDDESEEDQFVVTDVVVSNAISSLSPKVKRGFLSVANFSRRSTDL